MSDRPTQKLSDLPADQLRKVRLIATAGATIIFILGCLILMFPQDVKNFLGMSREISSVLGGAIIFVSIIDFILIRKLFTKADTR